MFRVAATNLAKRAVSRASPSGSKAVAFRPVAGTYQQSMSFHASAPRKDEEKKTESEVAEAEGFLGTGLSQWYALPVGVAFAVPMLEFEWYLVNEETLLASSFLAFCVVVFTQGRASIDGALKDKQAAVLKLHNDAEDQLIEKLELNLEELKLTESSATDYEEILGLTQQAYDKLNAAGQIKPHHELKAQVEKVLAVIATEEQNSYEKAKIAMMSEATESVTAEFESSKELKKAALDNALAKLTGKSSKGGDPVLSAYSSFFAAKTAAAKKADAAAEVQAARAAMVAKLNTVAENDGMFFRFDESGKPTMVV